MLPTASLLWITLIVSGDQCESSIPQERQGAPGRAATGPTPRV